LTKKNSCSFGNLCLRVLAPFFLWFGISPRVLALTPQLVDLKTLGYNRSIVLRGVNPEFEISVPAPKGGLDSTSSFVRLHLEPSSLLNENSSVRLLLYGEPVKVILVKSLQANPIVTLPLPPVPPGESFINLSVQSNLFISNDSRRDLPTGNLFLKIGNDSFFQVTPKFPDNSIEGFFKSFYKQVNLSVPSELNQTEAEVALWLYSVLAYQFREQQVPIFWRRDQAPTVKNSAQVILHTDPTGPDIERRGSTLRVRANGRAIRALTTEFYQPALVGEGLTVEAVNPLDPKPVDRGRSFKELGFKDRSIRVSGTQAFSLKFDLAQLGGRPKDLDLFLNATFTPIDSKQGDRLTAQVYFNNTLVQGYNLTNQTALKTTLSLPAAQLLRTNNLEILFSHTRSEENSQVGTMGAIAQVHGDSFFTWSGYQGPTGQLSDLPHVFLHPGQLIVDTRQPALLAATAYFLGVISRLGQQPVFPQLVASQSIKDWSNLPKDQSNKPPAWRLLALPPQEATFPSPIRLNQSFFEIYNPLNQQRLLKAQPTDPFGILQYFSYKGTPTIWLSWWGLEAEMAEKLGQALGDPRTLLASQLDGNVITTTDSQRVQTWDLGSRTLQVTYPETRNWQIVLQRYNNLLVTVSLILGGVIAWRIYLRTARPPVAPTLPSNPVEKTEEL
jgi:hypothetical protein